MSKVIGLEIGSANTKIVLGKKNKNNFELLKYRILSNGDGVYDYDGHLAVNEMVPQLTQVLKEMGGLRKKCYLTISSNKSIVRNRVFPNVKKKELEAMVQIEAEQFLPYEANSFYIDYRVLGVNDTGDDKSLNIMVVAVPKDIIDEAVQLVEECKLTLECVNVFTDAIHSYHHVYTGVEEENTLIADIGHNHMRMIAFREKEYFANINAEVGVKNLENYYDEFYNIPKGELGAYLFEGKELTRDYYKKMDAEDIQKDFGSLNFTGSIEESEDESVTLLKIDDKDSFTVDYDIYLSEINKMLGYFRSRKYGSRIDKIFLCGGGAGALGLVEAIETGTEIQTALLSHPGQENQKDSHLLISTIGTILRG